MLEIRTNEEYQKLLQLERQGVDILDEEFEEGYVFGLQNK